MSNATSKFVVSTLETEAARILTDTRLPAAERRDVARRLIERFRAERWPIPDRLRSLSESVAKQSPGGEFGTETVFRITGTKPLKNPVNEQTPPAHPSCRCSVGLTFDAPPLQQLESRVLRGGESGVARVPKWNPDTDTFVGLDDVPIEFETDLVPAEHRDELRRLISEGLDEFAPEYRPPLVRFVPESELASGAFAQMNSFGIKAGRGSIDINADVLFFNDPATIARVGTNRVASMWDEIPRMVRHEVGHRVEQIALDAVERIGESAAALQRGFDDVAEAWLRGTSRETADTLGLTYPWNAVHKPHLTPGGRAKPGRELFAELLARVAMKEADGLPDTVMGEMLKVLGQ